MVVKIPSSSFVHGISITGKDREREVWGLGFEVYVPNLVLSIVPEYSGLCVSIYCKESQRTQSASEETRRPSLFSFAFLRVTLAHFAVKKSSLCNFSATFNHFISFFYHIDHRKHKVSHRHVYIQCVIVYCPRIFGAMCFNLLQGIAKNTKCQRRNAKTKPVLLCVPSRYLGALCGKKIIALQLLCNLYSFHSFFHHIGHRSHKVSHRHVYILCGIVYCPRIFGAMCFN